MLADSDLILTGGTNPVFATICDTSPYFFLSFLPLIAFRVLGGIVNYQLGKIGASRITGSTAIWCDASYI
jgi:membrane protein YqaA with SNARE-associated domain